MLGKAHWPGFKNLGLTLPKELLDAQTIFIDFYNKTNNFRNLEFIYPLCNVVVEANFEKCKCEITMSLLQFFILSFFTRTKGATFKELMVELGFDEEALKKNLHSLVDKSIHILYTLFSVTESISSWINNPIQRLLSMMMSLYLLKISRLH